MQGSFWKWLKRMLNKNRVIVYVEPGDTVSIKVERPLTVVKSYFKD